VQKRPVVAGILVRNHQVLLCHRSADRAWFPDVWHLPGGHVEPGESAAEVLVRELAEELGIEVDPPTTDPFTRIEGPDFELVMWVLDAWSGEVSNRDPSEHNSVAWFDTDAVPHLALAHPSFQQILTGVIDRTRVRSSGRMNEIAPSRNDGAS
jgi:8-oxo-dGTP diphosphatase